MSDGKMWEIEDGFFSSGVGTICGVDEAGAGPLMGRWLVPCTRRR